MSSSASGPQDAAGPPRQTPAEDPAQEGPAQEGQTQDRAFFESVLRKTLDESDSGAPPDPAEKEALLEVVRRYRGQPLVLQPVATELVQALLHSHFQGLSHSPEFWQGVSAQIAQTLFDDPLANPRLEAFWRRLCGVQS